MECLSVFPHIVDIFLKNYIWPSRAALQLVAAMGSVRLINPQLQLTVCAREEEDWHGKSSPSPGRKPGMGDFGLQDYLENFEAVNVKDTNIVFLVLFFHCFVDSLGRGEEERGRKQENRGEKK